MAGVLNSLFDEVGGFRFLRNALDELVSQGRVRQIHVMRAHWWAEEWFLDVETNEIYSYVPLAERIAPEWRKVDLSDVSGEVKRESLGEYLDRQAGPSPEGLSRRGFLLYSTSLDISSLGLVPRVWRRSAPRREPIPLNDGVSGLRPTCSCRKRMLPGPWRSSDGIPEPKFPTSKLLDVLLVCTTSA